MLGNFEDVGYNEVIEGGIERIHSLELNLKSDMLEKTDFCEYTFSYGIEIHEYLMQGLDNVQYVLYVCLIYLLSQSGTHALVFKIFLYKY